MAYAENTSVSVARTKAEIEDLLTKHGATRFMSGWVDEGQRRATIGFSMKDRHLRFELPLPAPNEKRFTLTERYGHKRSQSQAVALWEQSCRQRWRALLLAIKAKLESIESGIETFDEAFMAQVVLPDGRTVSQFLSPQLDACARAGRMPTNLLLGGDVQDDVVDV